MQTSAYLRTGTPTTIRRYPTPPLLAPRSSICYLLSMMLSVIYYLWSFATNILHSNRIQIRILSRNKELTSNNNIYKLDLRALWAFQRYRFYYRLSINEARYHIYLGIVIIEMLKCVRLLDCWIILCGYWEPC